MADFVSNLQARLSLDDADFAAVMRRAVGTSVKASKEMGGAFAGLGSHLAGALSVGAGIEGGKALIEFGSGIRDMSDAVSMSAEKFQQFSFAVEQSGGSQEAFEKGMSALIQKVESARSGNEAAIASFSKLGISMADVASKSPDQILLMIADALKKSGGAGAEFAATADIIGAKVALKMVPALKDGSEAFLKVAGAAGVASEGAINAADRIGDKWDSMMRRLKTQTLQYWLEDLPNAIKDGSIGQEEDASSPAATAGDMDTARYEAAVARVGVKGRDYGMSRYKGMAPQQSEIDDASKAFHEDWQARLKAGEELRKNKQRADAEAVNQRAQELRDADEIVSIWKQADEIKLETERSGMSEAERMNSLLLERGRLTKEAARYEREASEEHRKQAALLLVEIARLDQRLDAEKRSHEQTATESFFEQTAREMRERAISKVNNPASGQQFGRLIFNNPSLQSGGLVSGGSLVALKRRQEEDAARAKEETKNELGSPGVLDRLEAKWQ